VLKEKLAAVQQQREVQRRSRRRAQVLSVALVGYTNAGKSTLFNALTQAGAYVADQLFATLDTTTRKLQTPMGGEVVLSDTVGFIRDLPPTLVAAFRATLEETVQADLLLHAVDSSGPEQDMQIAEVNRVLANRAGEVPDPGAEQGDLTGLPAPAWSATSMVDFAPSRERQDRRGDGPDPPGHRRVPVRRRPYAPIGFRRPRGRLRSRKAACSASRLTTPKPAHPRASLPWR
jgi:hypothetical protein